jgi:hypothetical protein
MIHYSIERRTLLQLLEGLILLDGPVFAVEEGRLLASPNPTDRYYCVPTNSITDSIIPACAAPISSLSPLPVIPSIVSVSFHCGGFGLVD